MTNTATEPIDPRVWKITAVAVLGSFLSQLDATVVNVSLSALATDLHTTIYTIQWVTSGYLLALALMLPLNGWLVSRIGAKRLYLWCFSTFTLSSALCGMAWSAESLIAFRVLQGLSGGLLAPMAQMMMARAAGRNITRILGYAAAPVLLGPVLGPVIAGAILQHATWRWLFLVNLPVGVGAVILSFLFLPNKEEPETPRSFDLTGFLLLSPALVLFLYATDHIRERIGIILLCISLALLATFIRGALCKGDRSIMDIRLFRGQTFTTATVTQFLSNGISFAGQMLIPLYLIRVAGLSPSQTGWALAPLGLGMMCMYPQMGRLTAHFGIRAVSATGALWSLLATLPFLYLIGHPYMPRVLALALFLRGMGLGAVGVPSISAAYASIKKSELPMATTALNILQRLGGPTFTTLCATFLAWKLTTSARPEAFTATFALLCAIHLAVFLSALRLPRTIAKQSETTTQLLEAD